MSCCLQYQVRLSMLPDDTELIVLVEGSIMRLVISSTKYTFYLWQLVGCILSVFRRYSAVELTKPSGRGRGDERDGGKRDSARDKAVVIPLFYQQGAPVSFRTSLSTHPCDGLRTADGQRRRAIAGGSSACSRCRQMAGRGPDSGGGTCWLRE